MTYSQLLLTVIVIQQGLFGLVWVIAAQLGLARRAALHWAGSTVLVTAGLGLILARGQASPWLTVALANVLIVLAFVIMRRGVQVFGRLAPTDREQAAVLLLSLASLAGAVAHGGSMLVVAMLASAALGWTLLRSAHEIARALGGEFGVTAARWCAMPSALIGGLFVLRGVLAPLLGEEVVGAVHGPGTGNTGMAFASLVFGLLVNTMLVAMTVLRLVRRLQYQSEHDVLTDLLNRRAMERLLEAEMQRQRRFGGHHAILSVDIDHFKQINDRWGHPSGDAVLVRVARALHDSAREVDRVARMGGEEFCLLLPGIDRAGAERMAQRLLEVMRRLEHPELGPACRVTVSIGLVVVESGAEALPDMMRRLDHALYAAKRGGRDRVEHAQPLAAT